MPTNKPTQKQMESLDLPVLPDSYPYAGNFNYRRVDWRYDNNSVDGVCLTGWLSIDSVVLLFNIKLPQAFIHTGTNPDFAFASGPYTVANLTELSKKVSQVTTSTFADYAIKVCFSSVKHAC